MKMETNNLIQNKKKMLKVLFAYAIYSIKIHVAAATTHSSLAIIVKCIGNENKWLAILCGALGKHIQSR